jgi:hypothetical protein
MKTIKNAIYNHIPPKYKFQLLRSSFLITNPRFLFSPNQLVNQNKRPILIVSMPRSGSSWVGDIFSCADSALYLMEPVNQSYRLMQQKCSTVASMQAMQDSRLYKEFLISAFVGNPKFLKSNIVSPSKWLNSSKDNVRVIKEVNPLVLDYIVDKFQPKIVCLLRNPVAVANSYFNKGWLGNPFGGAFNEQEYKEIKSQFDFNLNNNFWHDFGVFQAVIEANIKISYLLSTKIFVLTPLNNFRKFLISRR